MKRFFDFPENGCAPFWDDVSSTSSCSSTYTPNKNNKENNHGLSPSRPKKRQRGVTFFHDAFVYDIDRTEPSMWYSKEDIRYWKHQAKQLIFLAQQGRFLEESEHHTYHGLDKFFSRSKRQTLAKHRVLDAVLNEQIRQYNDYGRVDSESLAVVYQKTMEQE